VVIASKQAWKTQESKEEAADTMKAIPRLALEKEVGHPPEHVLRNLADHSKITSQSTKKSAKDAEHDCRIAENSYLPKQELHRKFSDMLALL